MVCLGFKPVASGWRAHKNPLIHGPKSSNTYMRTNMHKIKYFLQDLRKTFKLIESQVHECSVANLILQA